MLSEEQAPLRLIGADLHPGTASLPFLYSSTSVLAYDVSTRNVALSFHSRGLEGLTIQAGHEHQQRHQQQFCAQRA